MCRGFPILLLFAGLCYTAGKCRLSFALPFNLAPTLISDHKVCVLECNAHPYRHCYSGLFLALFGSSPMDNHCYSFLFFFGYRQPCIQLEDFEKNDFKNQIIFFISSFVPAIDWAAELISSVSIL
jgi:hypothetical protein